MSELKSRKKRESYSEKFKLEIVKIYNSGALTRNEIIQNYNLAPSTLDRWIHMYKNNGSVSPKSNETEETKMIKALLKEIEELKKVIYILKQATAILAQKDK